METNNKKEKEMRNIDNLISEEVETEAVEAEEIVTEEKGFNWLPLVIVAAILAVVIIAIIIIVAMNNGKKETTQTEVIRVEGSSEEVSIEETTEEQTEAEPEQLVEESVVEEPSSEEVVEGPQTVGQWSKSLDKTEPKLTIWNSTTKEGIVLENGNEYKIKEGDQLVICCSNRLEDKMTIYSSIIESDIATEVYETFIISEVPMEPTEIKLALTENGVEYVFDVFIVSENAEN